jgi:hypothetical protein
MHFGKNDELDALKVLSFENRIHLICSVEIRAVNEVGKL